MLEIYFDGVLLDPIYYMDLTQQWVMFDKEFKLGATPSRQFVLTIPKSQFNENIQEVKLRYMDSDYAYLIIDKVSYEEATTIPKAKITLVDKMVKADFYYDASELCPTTLKLIMEDICSKMGVELGNEHFDNEDIAVDFWDNTVTAREYISYISEMAGGYARIESDGKLWIRKFNNQNATTIDAGLCEQIIIGQKHKVERVVFDNGILKLESPKLLPEIPSEYCALQYIESNGYQYINTGYIFSPNDEIDITIMPLEANVDKAIFGEYSSGKVCELGFLQGKFRGNVGSGGPDYTINKIYNIKSQNGQWRYKNVPFGIVSNTAPSIPCYLFARNYGQDTKKSKIRFYNLIINRGNNTIHNFIPCYRISDGVIGIYDISQDVFLTNDGTGEFIKGGEIGNLETVYLNSMNVYCNTQDELDVVANNILGFEYYNLDTGKTYILNNSMCGDVLKLTYEGHDYYTINNTPDLKYMGAWQGKYVFNVESQEQAETKVRGVSTQVKAIKIKQNRDENVLSIAVEDIKTQQNVTNPQLEDKITANTTLINQTANDIRLEVSASDGVLQGNIDNVASDLAEADGRLSGAIANNTTLINQIATAIISTIRSTGGSNLLRNSVGYSGTDFWTSTGTVETNQDDNMSLSGSEFILTGASTLSQAYNTQPGFTYSVSCRIKHRAVGTANQVKIEIIGQGGTSKTILDTTETFSEWHDVAIDEPYTATITNPTIKITCTGDDVLEITDLIVAVGDNQVWSGYFDEVYGKEHKLDRNGLRLSNLAGNTASKTTSNSIQMLIGEMVVAELSKQVVKSDTAVITNSFTLGNLQTVVLDNDNIIEYI